MTFYPSLVKLGAIATSGRISPWDCTCSAGPQVIGILPQGRVKSCLLRAFYEAQGLFVPWFLNCSDLHSALTEARRQCTAPASQCNWPSPDYVTAFLLAANGDAQTGMKVKEKLLACANGGGIVCP